MNLKRGIHGLNPIHKLKPPCKSQFFDCYLNYLIIVIIRSAKTIYKPKLHFNNSPLNIKTSSKTQRKNIERRDVRETKAASKYIYIHEGVSNL